MTWLNKEHLADIIQSYLSSSNITMSREDIIVLAKKIRKPMWEWHIYIGYVLTGLFAVRFTLPLFSTMIFANPFDSTLSFKAKFQYWVYVVFYIGILISLTTGLIIGLGPKDLKGTMENLHVLSLYYLIPFIVIHLGGVLLAEFSSQPGIISKIVSGKM